MVLAAPLGGSVSVPKNQTVLSVSEAIACFARIPTTKPKRVALYEAIGQRVAEDIIIRRAVPATSIAATDGWAVSASETQGATKRQPRVLQTEPRAIDCCQPMPDGADAVVTSDALIKRIRSTVAIEEVQPGFNVIGPAEQVRDGSTLVKAGARLTLAAGMSAGLCGVIDVMIRRPVVDIIFNSPGEPSPSMQFVRMAAAAIRTSGSDIGAISTTFGDPADLRRAILESSADVICTIGGTGSGPGDCTMQTLAELGDVLVRGVRLKPGGTFGLAIVDGKPIFASPGGLADMLAANIVFSSPFARRVFGRPPMDPPLQEAKLAEAIPASGAMSHLILGTIDGDRFVPILREILSPADIASAQAVVFLPEGARHKRVGETVSYIRLGAGI
jgi:molybdopterin molybdotransferase